MRVAVTGVTGFVGGAVARRLRLEGHDVVGVGRRPHPEDWPDRYVRWDLADGSPAPASLREVDAVVHAAAHVATWGPDATFARVTVDGTARLLDALAPDARVVLVGTSSVYVADPAAATPRAPVREADGPVPPDRYPNAYARTKAAQELLVRARFPNALVLRPRAVWGPGDRTLLPRVLARVRCGLLPLPGGGRAPASFTHVYTLVDAVIAGLARAHVTGPVNVADATSRPTAELVEALGAALGSPIRVVPVPSPVATGAALALEAVYRAARTRREPPLTRYAVAAFTRPVVLDLRRLHGELGVVADRGPADGMDAVAAGLRDART